MRDLRATRESGVAILLCIVLMSIVMGVTGSVLMVSTTQTRRVERTADQQAAFYLAEAGLEAAKWEIGDGTDPAGDGLGAWTEDLAEGSCAVTAQDLGGGLYELTSTGTAGTETVSLRSVVGKTGGTAFPEAAVSVVGDVDLARLRLRWNSNLVLDGGDSPALSVNSKSLYEQLGLQAATAVLQGKLPLSNITGSPLNEFQVNKNLKKLPGLPALIRKYLEKTLGAKKGHELAGALASGKLEPQVLAAKLPQALQSLYKEWKAKVDSYKKTVELPIHQQGSAEAQVDALADLYDQLVEKTQKELIPKATVTVTDNRQALLKNQQQLVLAQKQLAALSSQRTKQAVLLQAAEKALAALQLELEAAQKALTGTGKKAATALQASVASLKKRLASQQKTVASLEKSLAATDARIASEKKAIQELQAAIARLGENNLEYGSEESPSIVHLSNKLDLAKGDQLAGYGTLVIDDRLTIKKGASLTWNGDVIVTGDKKKLARIFVDGGSFNVTGNVVILGREKGKDFVTFRVRQSGEARVTGSLFMATSYADNRPDRARLWVENGKLLVDGLVTMLGRKSQLIASAKGSVSIQGMLQMGSASSAGREKLLLNAAGSLEAVKDDERIQVGMAALKKLGAALNIGKIGDGLLTQKVASYSWSQIPPDAAS